MSTVSEITKKNTYKDRYDGFKAKNGPTGALINSVDTQNIISSFSVLLTRLNNLYASIHNVMLLTPCQYRKGYFMLCQWVVHTAYV